MKLKINLKNCYGICSLEQELDFSTKNVFSIYASNGTMKTSLAKTFMDLSKGAVSKDEIYTTRETKREIKKDGSKLEKDEVFVIKPYDQEYKSDDLSTLLVNPTLKKQFDKEYKELKKEKEEFLNLIQKLSGLQPEEIENEICKMFFQGEVNKFFEALARIEPEVLDGKEPIYKDIKYNEIFNDKTTVVIEKSDFIKNIDNYVKKYNELLEKSNFFKKGIFNHIQASDVASQLEKNGFFKAGHSVFLIGNQEQIKTKSDLEKVITKEKDRILQDKDLKKEFEKLDKILKKNVDLKNFREYLSKNPQIVSELSNPDSFKAKLWINYFKQKKENFQNLMLKFRGSKEKIEEIKKTAKTEKCDWHKVIDEFNHRFFVPFSLHVGNQIDVMLSDTLPKINFKFDNEDVEEKKLLEVLSQGEKRALYILNVLFEVEVRKRKKKACLLVIDDIADSFDYKNKYAIIEYLQEISKTEKFYLIILTHNFDFHRSICSRLDMQRENKLNAVKLDKSVKLNQEIYQKNPLNHWRDNLDKPVMLFAAIPMIRNLFEYSGKEEERKTITSFLHIKDDTKKLTIQNLKDIYGKCLDITKTQKIKNVDKKFYDLLTEECDNISDGENLENKIILSIAIRLKAEEFMIEKINDKDVIKKITGNQTFKLFEEYKKRFSDDKNIKTLERVNLMTPENIHLNSFMYEPILDMSSDELKTLYKNIKNINGT